MVGQTGILWLVKLDQVVLGYPAYFCTQNIQFPCIFLSEYLHLKWSFSSNSLLSLCWASSFQEGQRLGHCSTCFHISIHSMNNFSTFVNTETISKTSWTLKKHAGRWHSTKNMLCLPYWKVRVRWLIPSTANALLFSLIFSKTTTF